MSESRAIVYGDGSCREIMCCGRCGSFSVNVDGTDEWGTDILSFACTELRFKLKCTLFDDKVAIVDYNKILNNCPLPLWDAVRWYDHSEITEYFGKIDCEYVEVRLKHDDGRIQPVFIKKVGLGAVDKKDSLLLGTEVLKWRPVQ